METGERHGAFISNREGLGSAAGDVAALELELAFSWESFRQGAPLIPSSICEDPPLLKNFGFLLCLKLETLGNKK